MVVSSTMMFSRCRFPFIATTLACTALILAGHCQETEESTSPPLAKIGVLLDTSAEMGFLVPQARKEIRLLNEELDHLGRTPVTFREMEGASIDRESSITVPARKNALYALKELYEEAGVDTVYWITALRGLQSGDGIFAIQQLLETPGKNESKRRLIIRHVWQDQLHAGLSWIRKPPSPELDTLDPRNFPEEWYRLLSEDRGLVMRSWQIPPEGFRNQFAFPYRIANATYLKKLEGGGREALMDQTWARQLTQLHGLEFIRPKEEWLQTLTGRRWLFESSLVPFINKESLAARTESIFDELRAREPIEGDLTRIPAKKLGVLFGFGYVKSDLDQMRNRGDRPVTYWKHHYASDLALVVGEIQENQQAYQAREIGTNHTQRVYVSEMVALNKPHQRPAGPDLFAVQMAKLVREEKVDAIYFMTNGYLGGGDYGTYGIDEKLVALAIREAGVPIYLRIPFEFGPVPISLQRLVLASGGGIFFGTADDEDWQMSVPSPNWPDPGATP